MAGLTLLMNQQDRSNARITLMYYISVNTENNKTLNMIALEYPAPFTSSTPASSDGIRHIKYDFTFYDKSNRIRFDVTADNKQRWQRYFQFIILSLLEQSIQLYIYLRAIFYNCPQIFDEKKGDKMYTILFYCINATS